MAEHLQQIDSVLSADPQRLGAPPAGREKEISGAAGLSSGEALLSRQRSQTNDKESQRTKKVVSIDESDAISPLMLGKSKYVDDFSLDRLPKQRSAKVGKRISGRLSTPQMEATRTPVSDVTTQPESAQDDAQSRNQHHGMGSMIDEVTAWLQVEKERRKARKAKLKARKSHATHSTPGPNHTAESARPRRESSDSSSSAESAAFQKLETILGRSTSRVSLERIPTHRLSTTLLRRPSSLRKLRRQSTVSSDTEYELDQLVPSCDVVLDNSKTLSYLSGASASSLDLSTSRTVTRDRQYWLTFKYEILRLTHTLKFPGWRYVPMENSSEIDVERLSGALTNAVYVVSPPSVLPPRKVEESDGTQSQVPRKTPPKLLLRIYGPQVEHLIDREAELQILQRLARKRIGPRLLGTFTNGRFEQYFHARTLQPQDLRNSDTSKQIAMRMRELHDGIELLDEERDAGPFVWRNWDKWVDRCQKVISVLDKSAVESQKQPAKQVPNQTTQEFVCGAQWELFRETVEKYRAWLDEQYGGASELREQLIFAHNDTQYGNILRIDPPGESPMLHPANKHKQLIVIDFEYSSANMPGLEFANHFTEWCYNYHDTAKPFGCNSARYPTPEEQHRFVRAYVMHRPQYAPAASTTPRLLPQDNLVISPAPPTVTPARASTAAAAMNGIRSAASAISHSRYMPHRHQRSHDSNDNPYFPSTSSITMGRVRSSSTSQTPGPLDEDADTTAEIAGLLRETRLWRIANHAQWVAWGIVQAKVAGVGKAEHGAEINASGRDGSEEVVLHGHGRLDPTEGTDPLDEEAKANVQDLKDKRPEGHSLEQSTGEAAADSEDDAETEEEFDYLGYARERAMFFWGDCLQLGLVSEEILEQWGIAEQVKVVPY